MRTGGLITEPPERPDDGAADATTEFPQGVPGEPSAVEAMPNGGVAADASDATRLDMPVRPHAGRTRPDLPAGRRADPAATTRQDLPTRTREILPVRRSRPAEGEESASAPRRHRGRWVWRAIAVLFALVIVTPMVVAFRVWWVARQDDRPRSDAIVVLGAAQYNGVPSSVLEWRLQHALALYRDGVAPAIVTVGGKLPGDNYTEASSGKLWLNEHGVPIKALVAVNTGRDTLQSMQAVGRKFEQLHWHTAVLVTDPPHALRSRTMARDSGIDAVTSPTRSGPTVWSRKTEINYIARETGGYLYYAFVSRWFGDSE